MKHALFALPLAAVLILSACESADGGDGDSASAPQVLSFFISPATMFVGETKKLTAKVKFKDSDGNLSKILIRSVDSKGSDSGELALAVPASGATEGTQKFTLDYKADAVGDVVFTIVLQDADGQKSKSKSAKLKVKSFGKVANVCGAQSVDCKGKGFCYNVDPSTCDYYKKHGLTLKACDKVPTGNQAVCVTSLKDPTTADAKESQCTFVQWWSNPTDLKVDCRCGTSAVDVKRCKRPLDTNVSVVFGAGPQIRKTATHIDNGQGDVIGREWFVPVSWSDGVTQDQTMIFAINLDTGNRRHVSGTFVDPKKGVVKVGSGDAFKEVYQVVAGPDGMLYTIGAKEALLPHQIHRVDPKTGVRKLLYDEETISDALKCPNGSTSPGRKTIQMHAGSMAIDAAGNFYLSGTATKNPGPSILKLDKSTMKCSYVSMILAATLTTFTKNVGGGFSQIQFPFRALLHKDGAIYAITDTLFIKTDIATGDRTVISNAKATGGVGSGPVAAQGMGDYWTVWDKHHNMFWTIGGGKALMIAINPKTGDRFAHPCWHPGTGIQGGGCASTGRFIPGALDNGGMIIDPDSPRHLYVFHDLISIVRYDKQTANAAIFSL